MNSFWIDRENRQKKITETSYCPLDPALYSISSRNYFWFLLARSVRQVVFNDGRKTESKEKNVYQKVHIKSLFQWILHVRNTGGANDGKLFAILSGLQRVKTGQGTSVISC